MFRGLFVILLLMPLAACGLWGQGKWSAYSVQIRVVDDQEKPIAGAIVRSTSAQEEKTNNSGMAEMYYMNRGLHVITVSREGMETVQSKVNMPVDSGSQVVVTMRPLSNSR